MTSYEDVYRAFFDESLEVLAYHIEWCRDRGGFAIDIDRNMAHEMLLFDPVDRDSLYYTYSKMVESTQRLMTSHLEGLIRCMLDADGRGYTLGKAFTHPNGYRYRTIPLAVDMGGRRVGLTFRESVLGHNAGLREGSFDELLVVVATRVKGVMASYHISQNVRMISLEELFDTLFPGQYETFLAHVDDFNERAKELMAFALIEQPTAARMPDIRAECLQRLRSDIGDMRVDLSSGVYLRNWEGEPALVGAPLADQLDQLYKRFLDDGTCEAMVGTRDFAESYVSSEWLFQINELTRTLEQTGTAVGYIKSIEQLLYDVVLTFMDDEVYAMNWRDKDGVSRRDPWDKAFPEPDKLTLWSLIDFFSEDTNIGILRLDPPFDTILQQVLHDFRTEDRNKYLHKANLIGDDGLKSLYEVRRKAELIYLLVLGGSNITDSRLLKLGLNVNPSTGEGEDAVSEWAHRVVRLQAFRRDTALANGVELELNVDTTYRDARRAYAQSEGEYWELRIKLQDGGMTFRSDVLGQSYELPLTWRGRESWEHLAARAKSTLERALSETGVTGKAGAPLDVGVTYLHMDAGRPYVYHVHGPIGQSLVDKKNIEQPPNRREVKMKRVKIRTP